MAAVLAHFTCYTDEHTKAHKARCNTCRKVYAFKQGDGTGTLTRHRTDCQQRRTRPTGQSDLGSVFSSSSKRRLSGSPPRSPPAAAAASASVSVASSVVLLSPPPKRSKPSDTSPLARAFAPAYQQSITKLAAIAFATNRIAFAVSDNADFQAFMTALRGYNGALPNRKTVKQWTISTEQELRDAVLARLRSSTAPVAVAIDGWTNVVQSKVTNVVLLSNGQAFYWRSIANKTEKNTAVWLHSQLLPIVEELVREGLRVVALVADNEAVNGALFRLLQEQFPFLLHIPCAAHTVQLVVKNSLETDRWKKVRTTVDDMLKTFASSKEKRIELMKLQSARDGKKIMALVKPNDTRWNSFLSACERLLLLRPYIELMFSQTATPSFWKEMEALISFLAPFRLATNIIQADASTVYDIFLQWNQLTKHVKEMRRGAAGGDERAAQSMGAASEQGRDVGDSDSESGREHRDDRRSGHRGSAVVPHPLRCAILTLLQAE